MKKMYTSTILIGFIIILIDQISKGLVDKYIKFGESIKVINKFFYLTNINNTGAAWGMLSNQTSLLIIITFVVIALLFYYLKVFKKNARNIIAFGLLLGGIVGNLIDRLFLGYIKDFFELHLWSYNFPIFNIGDMCIVIGAILLIIAILSGEDKKSANKSRKPRSKRKAR
jgi:signal peptidase II